MLLFFFFRWQNKKKIIIDAEYSSRTESISRRHLAFCQIFNMYSLGWYKLRVFVFLFSRILKPPLKNYVDFNPLDCTAMVFKNCHRFWANLNLSLNLLDKCSSAKMYFNHFNLRMFAL